MLQITRPDMAGFLSVADKISMPLARPILAKGLCRNACRVHYDVARYPCDAGRDYRSCLESRGTCYRRNNPLESFYGRNGRNMDVAPDSAAILV